MPRGNARPFLRVGFGDDALLLGTDLVKDARRLVQPAFGELRDVQDEVADVPDRRNLVPAKTVPGSAT